jgi:hypothetical protein
LAGLAAALLLAACMPSRGWQRTDRRACAPQSPPIVCLTAEVEGPYELRVGDQVLLPGECMQAPADEGSGRLAVTLHVGGEELARRHLRLREGVRTTVRIAGERVKVVDEQRCDDRVAP